MKIVDENLDFLEKYGFVKKTRRWYGERLVQWCYIKPGRIAPTILIKSPESEDQADIRIIQIAHPSNYYWDSLPDVLLQLIKDGDVTEGGR